MNSIFPFIEGLDIKLNEISHDIIEHKEAGSFIDHLFFTIIDKIKDWC